MTTAPASASTRVAAAQVGAIVAALAVLTAGVLTSTAVTTACALVVLVVALALGWSALAHWPTVIGGLVAVIFLIPIKRYSLPAQLPFELEPYRAAMGLIALGWLVALLVDERVRLRRTPFDAPLALFAFAAVASFAANAERLSELGLTSYVVKSLTFFLSFIVLYLVVTSVLRSRADLDRLVRVMVTLGAVVALAAIAEFWTHVNVFNHLAQVLPMLQFHDPRITAGLDSAYLDRSGGMRAYASAAHPIELSAVLTMLLPLALYLARREERRRWLLAAALLAFGAVATLSRTGIVMLVVLGLTYAALRPARVRRALPLALPALVAVYLVLPNSLGSFYALFFPQGGIVSQQSEQVSGNHRTGDGRLADIGPSLSEASKTPFLGQGFGSRVTDRQSAQVTGIPLARILDDQWLTSLLETGLLGLGALLWLLGRAVRRLLRLARDDTGADGELALALGSAVLAFGVGMLTFDALGFVQVTLVLFFVLAIGASLLLCRAAELVRQAASRQGDAGVPHHGFGTGAA